MATDVSGFDPITVSLRDYIDGNNESHKEAHAREREAEASALASNEKFTQTVVDDHFRSHDKEHEQVKLAFDNYLRELDVYRGAHNDIHKHNGEALKVALDGVQRLAQIHAENHTKEHNSHEVVHQREREAATLARAELDVRLNELNSYRAQIREQANTFMARTEIIAQFEKLQANLDLQIRSAENAHTRMDAFAVERFKVIQDQIDSLKLSSAADSGAGQRTAVLFGGIISIILIVIAIAGFISTAGA